MMKRVEYQNIRTSEPQTCRTGINGWVKKNVFFQKLMNSITIGEVTVWDFGFRYNLQLMDISELEVIMIKYEVELKKTDPVNEVRYDYITEILGKLYREIMKRRRIMQIESVTNL